MDESPIALRVCREEILDLCLYFSFHDKTDDPTLVEPIQKRKAASGILGSFNLWNYQMAATEIVQLSAHIRGNVASWSTLREVGKPTYSTIIIPDSLNRDAAGINSVFEILISRPNCLIKSWSYLLHKILLIRL